MTTFSMEDLKKKISKDAISFFEENFQAPDVRMIYEAIRNPRDSSFRINPIKGERQEVIAALRKEGVRFKDAYGIAHAFVLDGPEKMLEKSTPYKEGKVYLQGLSGMLAPLFLAPRPGERVADLAAAPGSKTTMISALMINQGEIDAIEPDQIRLERLKFNANIMGATNITYFKECAEKFRPNEHELYDKILADVPCSGEGRFNLFDGPSYLSWKISDRPKFARLQSKILERGIKLLKPGGQILYSTCTLNFEENEGVVLPFIKQGVVQSIPLPKIGEGMNEFRLIKKDGLHALRILPSKRFEGFFLTLLKK